MADDNEPGEGAEGPAPTPAEPAEPDNDESIERMAHEPEAALAAHVLDPGAHATTFADDSALIAGLRKFDRAVGLAEQAVLFGMLAAMVIIACVEAVAERMHSGFLWSFDVVRDSTFGIAMLGAAFATHQQRNLSMDLVSRRLGPRARMVLRIFLALITITASALFFYAGWVLRGKVVAEPNAGTLEKLTVTMIPLGAGLIIYHSLVHIAIEVDYLARGKISPERERMGH